MKNTYTLHECLACGSPELELMLDLTDQPLANNYIKPGTAEETYPLAVNICQHCNHLQLTHVVDPEIIYKNYLYVSGTTKTYRDYMTWFANFVLEYVPGALTVLDIGCNDGSQLDCFQRMGLKTYGIDPAENLYPASSKKHEIWCDFFGPQLATQIDRQFDVVVAQNSFAHNPDPLSYLQSLKKLMHDDTLFFIQTSQADMVLNGEFDTIYHEHVNFYIINSMNELCRRAGLNLIDVVKTPIHGTSYVFVVSKTQTRTAHIANLIEMEATKGLMDYNFYKQWAHNVETNMADLRAKLQDLKDRGYKLVGYGAAAKGNTVLNYIKFPLAAVIDDNPLKQDHVTPGQHCPIVPSSYLDTIGTDERVAFIPLAWNFYKEIKTRILDRRSNDRDVFVRYFPTVEIE